MAQIKTLARQERACLFSMGGWEGTDVAGELESPSLFIFMWGFGLIWADFGLKGCDFGRSPCASEKSVECKTSAVPYYIHPKEHTGESKYGKGAIPSLDPRTRYNHIHTHCINTLLRGGVHTY